MTDSKVRVRFAPSPTGPLHMGGVRTALYNYLFAKRMGGTFILRIEDTDQKRYVEGAEDYILSALKWCGIEPQEGHGYGGDFGPYKQSERKTMYADYAYKLVESGHAYYTFDTEESVTKLRAAAEAEKKTWQYDASTRMSLKNSLTMPKEEVQASLEAGTAWTIRFKIPENEEVVFTDLIRGVVRIQSKVLDDKVLLKGDGMPTYHLANIVDDHLMEISHVIRGEEWLPSAPLHNLLYHAFGWDAPQFAHLPLILKPTGNGKLSKRDGDAGGFPIFPLEWTDPKTGTVSSGYKESGYFSEAFINMLLMLGWNPGTEQELFTVEEAAAAFSLERVVKAGARFNPDKAKWFNEHYLRQNSAEELAELVKPLMAEKALVLSDEKVIHLCEMMAERSVFIPDLIAADYFFDRPTSYDEKTVKKKWKETTPAIMEELIAELEGCVPFSEEVIETTFKAFLERKEIGFGAALPGFRLCVTGAAGGPSMFAISAFLGKEETLDRMREGLSNIAQN
ncbi:MAG: glutamyl-tRNA synthetase [Flavobacteriales bacterium]|jgi:glutamyl-tRNA synthetase